MLPNGDAGVMLIDCGANAECTVEYLLQFAYLGSYYAQKVLGVENPRIGLLNIGAEESKGDTLRRETYQKLKEAGEAGHLNFTGNIEAKEAIKGGCDVIVCDGFSGNVLLKTMEGVGSFAGSAPTSAPCPAPFRWGFLLRRGSPVIGGASVLARRQPTGTVRGFLPPADVFRGCGRSCLRGFIPRIHLPHVAYVPLGVLLQGFVPGVLLLFCLTLCFPFCQTPGSTGSTAPW